MLHVYSNIIASINLRVCCGTFENFVPPAHHHHVINFSSILSLTFLVGLYSKNWLIDFYTWFHVYEVLKCIISYIFVMFNNKKWTRDFAKTCPTKENFAEVILSLDKSAETHNASIVKFDIFHIDVINHLFSIYM